MNREKIHINLFYNCPIIILDMFCIAIQTLYLCSFILVISVGPDLKHVKLTVLGPTNHKISRASNYKVCSVAKWLWYCSMVQVHLLQSDFCELNFILFFALGILGLVGPANNPKL